MSKEDFYKYFGELYKDIEYCETPTCKNPLPPRIYNWIVKDRFRFINGFPNDITKEEKYNFFLITLLEKIKEESIKKGEW